MGVYGHKTKKYEQHTHAHIGPHKRMPFISTWWLGEHLLAKTNRFGEGKTWKATAKEAERLSGARLDTYAGHKRIKSTYVYTHIWPLLAQKNQRFLFSIVQHKAALKMMVRASREPKKNILVYTKCIWKKRKNV